jgi:hypothetical protein
MLSNVVKFRAVDRRDGLSASFARAFSNNLTNRRSAGFASKIRREDLTCRWRINRAGRLECHWEVKSVGDEAKEPEPSRPIIEMSLQTTRLFEMGMVAA